MTTLAPTTVADDAPTGDLSSFCARSFAYYWQIGDRAVSLGWDEPTWLDYVAFQFLSYERFLTEEQPLPDGSLQAELVAAVEAASQEASAMADLVEEGSTPEEAADLIEGQFASEDARGSRVIVLEIITSAADSSDACGELEELLTEDRWLCNLGDVLVVAQSECDDGDVIGPA